MQASITPDAWFRDSLVNAKQNLPPSAQFSIKASGTQGKAQAELSLPEIQFIYRYCG